MEYKTLQPETDDKDQKLTNQSSVFPLVWCDTRPGLCFALDIATTALNPAVKDLHLDLLFDRTVGECPSWSPEPWVAAEWPKGTRSVKAVLSMAPSC